MAKPRSAIEDMKLYSPLSVAECRSILREQVAKRRSTVIFRPLTSKVVGEIEEERVVLGSGVDLFSKMFVGKLSDWQGTTVLEGDWIVPFWSRVWGKHRFDEEEIMCFLCEYAKFSPEPNQSTTAQRASSVAEFYPPQPTRHPSLDRH